MVIGPGRVVCRRLLEDVVSGSAQVHSLEREVVGIESVCVAANS